MAAIHIQNLFKQLGDKVVLQDLALDLHAGETTGLVGPNGAGKSTLFKIIAGEWSADGGSVHVSRSTSIGYLSQEPALPAEGTLHDAVASGFAELLALEHKMHEISERIAQHHAGDRLPDLMAQYDKLTERFEAAGGYVMEKRLGEVLDGLGFSTADRQLPVHALSGGQRSRAALAKLLLIENSFLLLDEPTNHLDIDAVGWLERFLSTRAGGAVVISHDRYLLDKLCGGIVELSGGGARSYSGNYSTYAQTRAVERETQARQSAQDREFIDKERAYINKFRAGQRARQAQGRQTRLERRIAAGEFVLGGPREQARIRLDFGETEEGAGEVLRIEELSKAYGERTLFRGLNLNIRAGRCLGITGPNGSGKSTLFKILQGQVAADAGELHWDPKTPIGYFAQDASSLEPARTILQEIQEHFGWMSETSIRSALGNFLFTRDDAFKRIGSLSGGEQSRVRMLKLMLEQPSALLLDEPTNHLDILSCEALETALLDYPGTILVISHDRYFLDRVVDQLLVIRPEGHRLIHGNYTAYLEQREREQAQERAAAEESGRPQTRQQESFAAPGAQAVAGDSKATKSAGAPRSARSTQAALRKSRFFKLSFEAIEQEIMQREARVAELQASFGDAATYKDPLGAEKLREQISAVQVELAELAAMWELRVSET